MDQIGFTFPLTQEHLTVTAWCHVTCIEAFVLSLEEYLVEEDISRFPLEAELLRGRVQTKVNSTSTKSTARKQLGTGVV